MTLQAWYLMAPNHLPVAANAPLTFPLMNEQSLMKRAILETTELTRGTRKLQKYSSEMQPIFQDYGAYYIDIFVGTPAQRQTVMIDTGSENTAIPCQGCENCGDQHTDQHFKQSESKSYNVVTCDKCLDGICIESNNTCSVQTSYVEGSSWKGVEVEDYILTSLSRGNEERKKYPIKFTCMTSNEGEFKKQKADGIMGLSTKKASFWKQLYFQGAISTQQFSLCVRKFPYVPLEPKVQYVGAMTLGGVDSRLQSSPMGYMDMIPDDDGRSLYFVKIRKIHLIRKGGVRLAEPNRDITLSSSSIVTVSDDMGMMNANKVIVDSGTTDTILPKDLLASLNEIWDDLMGMPFPTEPMEITAEELKTWPTILFQMKGSKSNNLLTEQIDEENPQDLLVAFPPSSYMRLDVSKKIYNPALVMHDDFGIR